MSEEGAEKEAEMVQEAFFSLNLEKIEGNPGLAGFA